jgi:hypothetical protein
MIDSMSGAHTDGDEDDSAILRVLRRITIGFAAGLLVVGLCLLGAGLALDDVRLWNLGCTFMVIAAGCGAITACLYIAERLLRVLLVVMRRLDDVEAGERLIAEAVQQPPDEVRRRREG